MEGWMTTYHVRTYIVRLDCRMGRSMTTNGRRSNLPFIKSCMNISRDETAISLDGQNTRISASQKGYR